MMMMIMLRMMLVVLITGDTRVTTSSLERVNGIYNTLEKR